MPLGDPAMGGHAGFAFGLALARPRGKVVLFDSEGDILMSLGMLATIAEQAPANFYHFLLDNECYATTGGQPVPNAKNVAYDTLALGAGYPRAHAFDELAISIAICRRSSRGRARSSSRSRSTPRSRTNRSAGAGAGTNGPAPGSSPTCRASWELAPSTPGASN